MANEALHTSMGSFCDCSTAAGAGTDWRLPKARASFARLDFLPMQLAAHVLEILQKKRAGLKGVFRPGSGLVFKAAPASGN